MFNFRNVTVGIPPATHTIGALLDHYTNTTDRLVYKPIWQQSQGQTPEIFDCCQKQSNFFFKDAVTDHEISIAVTISTNGDTTISIAESDIHPHIIRRKAREAMGTARDECFWCGKQETSRKFKLCSACKDARYCCTKCQRLDWKANHKKTCKKRGRKKHVLDVKSLSRKTCS